MGCSMLLGCRTDRRGEGVKLVVGNNRWSVCHEVCAFARGWFGGMRLERAGRMIMTWL